MPSCELDILIDAPAERVYRAIASDDEMPRWIPEMKGRNWATGTQRNEDGTAAVGSTFVQHIREGSRTTPYQGTILAREQNRMVKVRMGNSQMYMDTTWRTDPVSPTSTRATFRIEGEGQGWVMKLFFRLFWGFTKKLATRQLNSLKKYVEANP